MRKFSFNLHRAASLALLACSIALSVARTAAQTFDVVLSTNLFQPAGVTISPDNHYIISDTAHHRIVDFDVDNRILKVLGGLDRPPFEAGAVDGQGVDARFRNPQGLLSIGKLTYVADSGNHVIRVIDNLGNVKTIAGDITAAHEVDEFGGSPSNWGFVDGPAASAKFNGPSGLTADESGHLYIADSGNHAIRMLDLTTMTVSTVVRSGLTTPVSVALGLNGALFISDTGAHSIKTWTPGSTKAILLAGGGSPLARGYRDSAIGTNALFNAPAGIYYREATDELIVADSGNSVLRTVEGASSSAPKVDTFANTGAAGFQTPIAVTRDVYGVFLVCDSTRNTLASVITVKFPRIAKPDVGYIEIIIDQNTGLPQARLHPVTDSTFDNPVKIAVSGDATAQHHFTAVGDVDDTKPVPLPTTNSPTAVNFVSPQEPAPLEEALKSLSLNAIMLPRYNFHVKVFSASKGADERIPSLTTEAFFRFKCGTPQIDSQSIPGRLLFRCSTTNAVIYFTMDGSEPYKGAPTALSVANGDSIPLVVTTNTIRVNARAYLDDSFLSFLPSDDAHAEFSPENFVPNRISVGFSQGEASSLMRAAPGQRFFAPVTLSLMPGAKAYGLQFDLSLEPLGLPLTNDYKMRFNSSFIEQTDFTNRTIQPSVFVLTGTNFLVIPTNEITTNYTYEVTFTNVSTLPSTNYVLFTNKLPSVVPVVSTILVTNLGTSYTVPITNYVTNSFQLVSEGTTTNVLDIETNYLYSYIFPSVTNVVHAGSVLPASTPIILTNFVTNLGQVFPVTTTNFVTNAFDLVSGGTVTNTTRTVLTNFLYEVGTPSQTNLVVLDHPVDDSAQIITTNFVSNLGQQFPVLTTNRITNAFNLVSAGRSTNVSSTFLTNYLYQFVTAATTNFIETDHTLRDSTAVVTTNLISNLGEQFTTLTTNYINNLFNLLSIDVLTNKLSLITTNFDYRAVTPGVTNYISANTVLLDKTAVVLTNFVTNMGQLYPVTTTNYISNAFNLVSLTVQTNGPIGTTTNFLYAVDTPGQTNVILVDHKLDDQAQIITTNFVSNLGQQFPVLTTNYIDNNFSLVSYEIVTNSDTTVTTNFAYRTVTPGTTNFITVGTILPATVAVISTNFISNLGEQFPVAQTNIITNAFDLVSSAISSNVVSNVSTSVLYRFISAPPTNYITVDHFFPDPGPVVTFITATNQGQTYVLSTTNIVPNVFEFVSAQITTNVVNKLSYEYSYNDILWTNYLLWPTPLPDPSLVITTNTLLVTNQTTGVTSTFTINTTNTASSANLSLVFNDGQVQYMYAIPSTLPADKLISSVPITFPTNGIAIQDAGYIATIDEKFSEEFVTVIPNPTVSIVTNTVVSVDISTNAIYRVRPAIQTNYITLSTNLPDVAPVVSLVTITNEGQNFTFSVTNYASNVFDLVSTTYTTNTSTNFFTNAVYALRTPPTTNIINVPTNLPASAPIVTTAFVTNLGQLFPVLTTNIVANTFEFLNETHTTNTVSTPHTNATYVLVNPPTTNYVLWPEQLPNSELVLTTNFVSNLGRQFPVVTTNYIMNSFRFVQQLIQTNFAPGLTTNAVYAFVVPGVTNFLSLTNKLLDSAPVVTTTFLTNQGQLFPIDTTNYVANSFDFLGERHTTTSITNVSTNVTYVFINPAVTNYILWPELLPPVAPVLVTNFVSNLGRQFPVVSTNYVTNQFQLISSGFVSENDTITYSTNVVYEFKSLGSTNYLVWPTRLPEVATVITTNFVSNLGQLFPITVTNYLTNTFRLVSDNYPTTNITSTVSTDIVYLFTTPPATNYLLLGEILPPFVQVITTNFVTNLGRLFPVTTTNIAQNFFDLISTNVTTNVTVTPGYLYSVVTPGGANGQVTVTTNLMTVSNSQLPAVVPIVDFLGYATNLNQLYPVYQTNYVTNTFRLATTTYATNTLKILETNVPDAFTDLVITNYAQNFLAVGWVETYGRTNLYNTIQHDLLNLSMPNTATFVSQNGQAVPGSFSFVIPTNAATGDQYKVQVSRPSATADGISQDMYIQAPEEDDPRSPVKAVRTLTVTNQLGYLVGDISDFHWFNAGEFGDGSLLNNDITLLQRVIVYGLNVPPQDSDFLDAMDTCCFTEDGVDLSGIEFASSAIDLNKIAFGEGSRFAPLGRRPNATLAVNDLYVAFRRSADPNLNWYQRYWSNGMRQASIVPNSFRGKTGRVQGLAAIKPHAVQTSTASTVAPALTLYAGTVSGLPGKVVAVPIHARVDGAYPLRTLMFEVRVEGADGTVLPGVSLDVTENDGLGTPSPGAFFNDGSRSAVAWHDGATAGFVGDQVVGRVLFTIPNDAQAMNLYYVKLDRVSGSPNGISLFPVRSGNGLVAMANRPTVAWNDGIPDAWRLQYFGTLNDPRSAADVDADGDGLSNYEEYKLGTNPLDPNDNLRLQAASNGRGVKLRFHTANGKLYLIEGSSSLQPGSWSTVQTNVPGTGSDVELPSAGGEQFFYYRVRLQE